MPIAVQFVPLIALYTLLFVGQRMPAQRGRAKPNRHAASQACCAITGGSVTFATRFASV